MEDVFSKRRSRGLKAGLLSVAVLIIMFLVGYGIVTDNVVLAFAAALSPLVILLVVGSLNQRKIAFMCLFAVNFFIPVIGHYTENFPVGLTMDMMIVFNLFAVICNMLTQKIRVKNVSWDVVLVLMVWLLYCCLELLNKNASVEAWTSTIRSFAIYILLTILLVQTSIASLKDLKQLIFLWSILCVIAILKAVYQRFVGFTPGDNYFLYVLGGQVTHIIYYGVRYFSIFSDAANCGGAMGLAFVVFALMGLHTDRTYKRIYYWIVALGSLWVMLITGTRSAIAVPVVGLLLYIFLIRDFKKFVPVAIVLGLAVSFLAFTTIGQSNTFIRRARSAFNRTEEPSYQVRKDNQRVLRQLMEDKPFGNGLGLSGGRAKTYGDYSQISEIPTDSWYVQLWVETGVVGQILYFLMMLYLFGKGGILVFFKLKNKEIQGIAAAMLSGVAGLFIMASNNEVFTQFPNGITVYTLLGLVYLCPAFEKQLAEEGNDGSKTIDIGNNG